MRLRLDLQYDGSDFHGWQIQPNAISVQELLQNALKRLNGDTFVEVVGCGRTDTGVHASHYVMHCDFDFSGDFSDLIWKMNNMLPESIAILGIVEAQPDFHARFDAKARTYQYFINRKKNPFKAKYAYLFHNHLDVAAMNEAANYLLGVHDFTSFSKLHTDVKTNNCEVFEAFWTENGDELIFQIKANRFLRNMVRSVVGTLILVGEKKILPKDVKSILEKKDRSEAGRSVPGCGLFLCKIEY